MMMFPIECPTKLSFMSLQPPYLESLSIFFLRKVITSSANLLPISLKSPVVFSSLASDIRHSAPGSIRSHWFRTSRKSRWCPYYGKERCTESTKSQSTRLINQYKKFLCHLEIHFANKTLKNCHFVDTKT